MEEDICTHLIAVFKKLLSVFQLELIIVLIGLRSKSNFLRLYLDLLLTHFLLTLLLLIEKLAIVDDATNRWLSIGGYLHQVLSLLACQIKGFARGHYFCSTIAYHSYFPNVNLFVHAVLGFHCLFVILH